MKKTVLTAAFAALALSAAQAVTTSWTASSVTGNQTIGSFGNDTVFALTATLTVPGANGQDLFRFGAGTGATTNYIKVAKNVNDDQAGILRFWAKGNSGNEDSRETTAVVGPNNEYSISMVVDQRNSASKVTLYVGGNMVGELTLTQDLGAPITHLVHSTGSLTNASIYTADAGEDIYDLAKRSSVDGHVVPEPTALALLALGVAGVALRRRAA